MGEPQEHVEHKRKPRHEDDSNIDEGLQERPRSGDVDEDAPDDAEDHLAKRPRRTEHVSPSSALRPEAGSGTRDQADQAALRQRGAHREQDAAHAQQEARNKAGKDAHEAQRVGPPHEPPEGQKDQKPPRDEQDRSQSELDENEQQAREQPLRK